MAAVMMMVVYGNGDDNGGVYGSGDDDGAAAA